jgi:hypothetical protein
MPISFIFWLMMLLWLIFGLADYRGWAGDRGIWGHGLFLFILFFILGWAEFGFMIRR